MFPLTEVSQGIAGQRWHLLKLTLMGTKIFYFTFVQGHDFVEETVNMHM